MICHPLPSTSIDCAGDSCKSVYNLCKKTSQHGSFLTLLWGWCMDDHDDVARIGGIAECCRIPFVFFLDPRWRARSIVSPRMCQHGGCWQTWPVSFSPQKIGGSFITWGKIDPSIFLAIAEFQVMCHAASQPLDSFARPKPPCQ